MGEPRAAVFPGYTGERMKIPELPLFRAPVPVWETTLWLEAPWTVPPTPGATPVSSLRGTLGKVLAAHADLELLRGYFKSVARPDLGGMPPRITLLTDAGCVSHPAPLALGVPRVLAQPVPPGGPWGRFGARSRRLHPQNP
jgi:hypothetical protein